MTVEQMIIYGKKHLSSMEAKMLLAYVLNYDTLELMLHLDQEISSDAKKKYEELIQARKENYPLQYIIGDVNFLGNRITVNKNVLIPRYETEDLVDRSIKYIKEYFGEKKDLKIIDLGTGSGCIAISLKKAFPEALVDAIDISSKALETAIENANINHVDVNFYQSDMSKGLKDKYDVIISNPPYIEENSNEVEVVVFKNEPHIALFAPNNGLYFYEEILKDAASHLKDKGMIIFEIGYKQGESLKNIANNYIKDGIIKLEQDMSGKDRFVFIYK